MIKVADVVSKLLLSRSTTDPRDLRDIESRFLGIDHDMFLVV
jgi:hypothetical protein